MSAQRLTPGRFPETSPKIETVKRMLQRRRLGHIAHRKHDRRTVSREKKSGGRRRQRPIDGKRRRARCCAVEIKTPSCDERQQRAATSFQRFCLSVASLTARRVAGSARLAGLASLLLHQVSGSISGSAGVTFHRTLVLHLIARRVFSGRRLRQRRSERNGHQRGGGGECQSWRFQSILLKRCHILPNENADRMRMFRD